MYTLTATYSAIPKPSTVTARTLKDLICAIEDETGTQFDVWLNAALPFETVKQFAAWAFDRPRSDIDLTHTVSL